MIALPTSNRSAVRRIDATDAKTWDSIARRLGGSVFHGSAWTRVLTRSYGYRPMCFVVGEGEDVRAALLVMEVDSWLTGRRGVSLPFTDECEPLGADADAVQAVLDAARSFGRERGWKYLEVRGGRERVSPAPASLSFYGHSLDLQYPEAGLFARLDASTRRAIRKAQQNEVVVEHSHTAAAVQEFYGLLCTTRKRHGLPPQPAHFFAHLHAEILQAGRGCVLLARRRGAAIAGAVYLHSGDTALYKYGASDERHQEWRGNNLVMWEAVSWHARNGFRSLDFGRTSVDNADLRAFKRGWGTAERAIEYVKYDLHAGRYVTDLDRSSGWHSRVFRAMPTAVSRVVGSALYKHMA